MQPLTDDEVESLKENLKLERSMTEQSVQEQTRCQFQDHAPIAAVSIVKLALHATNERVRLAAAEYVVDRVIGRIQDTPPALTDDPYEKMLYEVVEYVDAQRLER